MEYLKTEHFLFLVTFKFLIVISFGDTAFC